MARLSQVPMRLQLSMGRVCFDLTDAEIDANTPGLSVRAHQANDIVPSPIEGVINP